MAPNNKMKASWVIGSLIVGAVIGYLISNTSNEGSITEKGSMSGTKLSKATSNAAEAGTDEWKIQNAVSAAPDSISLSATVVDWPANEGDPFRPLRAGTNTWTCLPDFPVSPGNDPFCGDEMSMQWFSQYMSQKTPQIAQAGIGYMLQGGSDPSNTDPFATEPKAGESWMSAPPHIMIFPTGDLDTKVYGTDPMSGRPWIMWSGTLYEHLMIPVE